MDDSLILTTANSFNDTSLHREIDDYYVAWGQMVGEGKSGLFPTYVTQLTQE